MWWLLLIGAGLYLMGKRSKDTGLSSPGRPKEERSATSTVELPPRGTGVGGKRGEGLGVGGAPRLGKPKGEEERRKTHVKIFGSARLPERGSGRKGCCD